MISKIKNIIKVFYGKSEARLPDPSFLIQKDLIGANDNLVIFDIGAHEGYTVKIYKQLFPNASIHAFEPVSKNYELLTANTAGFSSVKTVKKALLSETGSKRININQSSATNSLLNSALTNSYIDALTNTLSNEWIESITIDQYCNDNNINNIDILKMDIQGSELSALRGAEKFLLNYTISLIYTEVEFIKIYEDQPLYHDVAFYLENLNYKLFNLYNYNYLENGQLAWADAIFLPKKK